MKGFTSTSLKKDEAFKFMFFGLNKDDIAVLYQINNLSENGRRYFKLDNSDYTLFPYEQEVLMVTGSLFTIIDISE